MTRDAQYEEETEHESRNDTVPAGMIPVRDPNARVQLQYVGVSGPSKGRIQRPEPASMENEFSISTTQRRGAGGRGSIARYGVEYIKAMDRRYAPLTKEAMVRRYKRMDKDADYLYKQGYMNSVSPRSMTKDDVHNFLVYRMNLGVSDSEMDHEISALKSMFDFCGNNAVNECLACHPYLRPKGRSSRLPCMSGSMVNRILECAMAVPDDDWTRLKAYAIPIWALATGMRSKELLLCNIDDIQVSGTTWTATVLHPKGEGSYGKVRVTIVDPDMYPFLLRYFKARAEYIRRVGSTSRALFPGGHSEGGYMQGNTARNLKRVAEEEVGFGFDLRICRRTFGQRLLDKRVSIELVSKLMGHKNTVTTEDCYCSIGNSTAVEEVSRMFDSRSVFGTALGGSIDNGLLHGGFL